MNVRLFLLFIGFSVVLTASAQINPRQGAKINYTQVMLEGTNIKGANRYIFQLTEDTTSAPFNHLLLEQKDSSTATLINGLQFGKKYQWRYAALKEKQPLTWKGPYDFEIVGDSLLQYNLLNIKVTKNEAGSTTGGLILNDCSHSIIDRNGNTVWYLPKINWHMVLNKKNLSVRPQIFDMRLTPEGTITYLADSIAVECDLAANRLWKAPNDGKVSGGTVESYNHSFKRLPNGNYMVLGNEIWRKLPDYKDTAAIAKKYHNRKITDGKEYAQVEFPTLIEYDKKGKVVWSWSSESYFDKDALSPQKDTTRLGNELNAHVNSFSVDKKNEFVYVGFRNLGRIIKIEKKTGNVIDSWGDKSAASGAAKYVQIHQQHDANLLDDSTIAVFNNNDYPGADSFASVVIIKQQSTDGNYVAWKFNCDFDSLDKHAERNGGNVDELKNHNLLVCMGNMNRIFEVTRNKKIVWEATLIPNGRSGEMFFRRLYRAHYISSLYPCYFTFKTDEDTLTSPMAKVHLKIFNKGSESDSYEVHVMSGSGTFIKEFTTPSVAAGKSVQFEIKSDNPLVGKDLVEVSVVSKTNPNLDKRVMLVATNKR